jgi:XTP/dITP diphosphohydrolase
MGKRELRKVPFFLEVSGLQIHAWNGLPGGLTKHFIEQVKCEGICKMMRGYADDERAATAVTALLFHNRGKSHPMIVGKDEGKIATVPRGDAGFHWDTIFVPKGLKKTYAELGQAEKNKRSPRKQVADQLVSVLRGTGLL